ncbi:MAG: hypothetical protein CVV27_10935 [Candidatus Melainabacteria bacterium HGW-Melainabacteria-1]|nr:MAG: hypothetical protein CVV27_10935 [Candidatus Melainabacteria bacterium HGW-Melainabacteria-1]
MKLAYLDPVRGTDVESEGPEALARQIADSLPPRATVRFTTRPFPLADSALKALQVHFEREKLPSRHDFSCWVTPAELTQGACEILAQLNFSELRIAVELADPAFAELESMFTLLRNHGFQVTLSLAGDPTQAPLESLSELYFFLRGHLGAYVLEYAQGTFDRLRVDHAFRRLAGLSQEVHLGRNYDAKLQEQFYMVLYEYLRHTLSPRVKTVLEINPFADLSYYRDFNRIALPWNVTLSGIQGAQLDLSQLQSLNKTFDAIVIFQALPRLRDPQKEILVLQNYARSTTEWVCVQYNTSSFPTLSQLLANQFSNGVRESAFWPLLRMQSRNSLENLFHFSGVNFEWVPTRVPIEELRPLKNQLDPIMKEELPQEWDRFLDDADVMAWTGYGVMQHDDAEIEAEGFVSGGFL